MHHFQYRDGVLHCEDVPLPRIAEREGTPTYIYSHATLERHYRVFEKALTDGGAPKHLVCYSVKANGNLAVLRALASWGAGFDTVSGGEIFRALRVGADPKKIVFSGVGKRADEIEYALENDILAFNVESVPELDLIEAVAARLGKTAPVNLRVNPDVDPETHPYISTGLKKNKFGIPVPQARAAFRHAAKLPHLEVIGIDCHIGSQLTKTSPFRDAVLRLGELARALRDEDGIRLRYLDVGGGLGIPYNQPAGQASERAHQDEPPAPLDYGIELGLALEAFAGLDVTLVCEPGRVIVGNAGVLLARTVYLKQGELKHFVILDAAMNDLIRPTLYDAYHAMWPVKKSAEPTSFVADVVGPICETGDFLARDRELAWRPEAGDLMAIMSAGAYGFTMSSNYNTRPRACEIMVRGAEYHVVRRRETLEDLVRLEEVPAFLRQ